MTFRDQLGRDLAALMNTDEWAETVTYRPQAGAEALVAAIFDENTVQVDVEAGVEVLSPEPRLTLRLADIPAAPAEGDAVVIREETMSVIEVRPDGHGAVEIHLHRAK